MKCAFYNKAQKEAINTITLKTLLSNAKFVFLRYSAKQANLAVHAVVD